MWKVDGSLDVGEDDTVVSKAASREEEANDIGCRPEGSELNRRKHAVEMLQRRVGVVLAVVEKRAHCMCDERASSTTGNERDGREVIEMSVRGT